MIVLSSSGDNILKSIDRDDRLVIGTVDGVWMFKADRDRGWHLIDRALEGCFVSALTLLQNGSIIAGTHGVGVARSDDEGKTWKWINQGIDHLDIWAVRTAVVNGREILLAGSMPAHLFASYDGGANWSELTSLLKAKTARWTFPPPPYQAHVKDILVVQDTIYVGIEIGALLMSRDEGRTFSPLPVDPDETDIDLHRILVHPDRPGRIIIANGIVGLMSSNDSGLTWRRGPFPPGLDYPDPLVMHPDNPDLLFVAGGVGWPPHWYKLGRAQGKIARSHDGGQTWERLLGGLPDGQRAVFGGLTLSAWHGGFDLFAADTDGQIFESQNAGDSWKIIAETAPVSKGEFYRALAKNRGRIASIDDLKFAPAAAGRMTTFRAGR